MSSRAGLQPACGVISQIAPPTDDLHVLTCRSWSLSSKMWGPSDVRTEVGSFLRMGASRFLALVLAVSAWRLPLAKHLRGALPGSALPVSQLAARQALVCMQGCSTQGYQKHACKACQGMAELSVGLTLPAVLCNTAVPVPDAVQI